MAEGLRAADPNNRIATELASDLQQYIDRRKTQKKRDIQSRMISAGSFMAGNYIPGSEQPLDKEAAAQMAMAGAEIKRRVAEMKNAVELEGMVASRRKLTNMAAMIKSMSDIINTNTEQKTGLNKEVFKQRSEAARQAWDNADATLKKQGWAENKYLEENESINSSKRLNQTYGAFIQRDSQGRPILPQPGTAEYRGLGELIRNDIQSRGPELTADYLDKMNRSFGINDQNAAQIVGAFTGSGRQAKEIGQRILAARDAKERMVAVDKEYLPKRQEYIELSLNAGAMFGGGGNLVAMAREMNRAVQELDPDAGGDVSGLMVAGQGFDPKYTDPAMEAAEALMEAFEDPYAPDSVKRMKAGIMQSQDFRNYMNSNQYENPEQAFKYLIKDYKKGLQQSKDKDIQQRRINMGKMPEEAELRGAVGGQKGVPVEAIEGEPVPKGGGKGLGSAIMSAGSKFFGGKRAQARAAALGFDPQDAAEPTESDKGLEDMTRQEIRDLPTGMTPEEAKMEGLDTTLKPEQEEAQAEQIIDRHSRVGAGTDPIKDGAIWTDDKGNGWRWDPESGNFFDTFADADDPPEPVHVSTPEGLEIFKQMKAYIDDNPDNPFGIIDGKQRLESTAQTYLTDVDTPFDEVDEAASAEKEYEMGRPGTTQTEKKGSTAFMGGQTRLGSGDVDKLSQWEVWKELDKRGLLSENEKAQLDVTRGEVSGDTQGDRMKKNITMKRMLKDDMLDESEFGKARTRLFNHLKTEVGAGEEKTIGGTRRYKPIMEGGVLKGYEEKQIGREETRTGGYIPLSLEERNNLVIDYATSVADKTGLNLYSDDDGTTIFFDDGGMSRQDRGKGAIDVLEQKLKAKGFKIVRGQTTKSGEVSGDDLDTLRKMAYDEGLTWEHVNKMGIRGDPTGERGDPSEGEIEAGTAGGMLRDDPFLPETASTADESDKFGGHLTRGFASEEEEKEDELDPDPGEILGSGPSKDIAARLEAAKQKAVFRETEMKMLEGAGQPTPPPSGREKMDAALKKREADAAAAAAAEKRRQNKETEWEGWGT